MPSPLSPPTAQPTPKFRRPIVVIPLLLAVVGSCVGIAVVGRRHLGKRPAAESPSTATGNTAASNTAASNTAASNTAASNTAAAGNTASATSSAPLSSAAPSTGTPATRFSGPSEGAVVGKTALAGLAFEFSGVPAEQVHGSIDGLPVTFTTAGGTAAHRAGRLTDGDHTFECNVDGASGDTHVTRRFTVDTASPRLAVTAPAPVGKGQPLTLVGTIDAGSTLTANGQPVTVTQGGWKAQFATAPSAVQVVASDPAGNTSTKDVPVHFPVPLTRAVHMTGYAWGSKPKHDGAMALLRAHKINAIEVDIKDEDGMVSYQTSVPLARTIGAAARHYTTAKMISEVHAAGGRVIGRLVAFRDPKLTAWAWNSGHHDMVLQELDGTPLKSAYGPFAFPNFANATVQQYNVDLAVEAAKAGFDDVLYDYVRRPDGDITKMKIPGLRGTPEQSVAAFVTATRAAFAAAGVTTYLGASVFGIAATRPREIAHDIGQLAPFLDYVAPMVYPSHWAPGEYKVADPNNQPYEIVQRSLKDFQKKVHGSNAAIIPWLQDFSLGVKYGPDQLRAQFKGAADDGLQSFLLWNAQANYTGEALTVMK